MRSHHAGGLAALLVIIGLLAPACAADVSRDDPASRSPVTASSTVVPAPEVQQSAGPTADTEPPVLDVPTGQSAEVAPLDEISGPATVSSRPERLAEIDDPEELTWAPPPLDDPETVRVGDDEVVSLDDGKDYRVVFPSTPVRHGVVISGGRNVVVIGGEISIPWQGDGARIYQRRGLLIRGQTGTIHIEGLLITGEDLTEGINIDAPDAIVQLQNVRIEDVHARDQVDFSDNHPDLVQPWGGVRELRIDRMSGQTDYQGIFLKEDFGAIGPTTLRRVDIVGRPTARYLLWNNDELDVTVDRTYVVPAPDRNLQRSLWPGQAEWPDVIEGVPPRGEFVPRELVGIGYRPWPYASADT